jgi:hypothetical protein
LGLPSFRDPSSTGEPWSGSHVISLGVCEILA